ncbi:ferredoxin [Amycolatopsis pithecellobii]|uniref:Ferredoxin n=1 Tax=Amycolatopsis pithecellobii TaxID=664692 RepID=A0A6N7YPU6_9PSEU|nr:ferredoxin [Amycolatopsis pithecellobii]MTD54022.1 ferredoxin [Amycolatopsis pithecellobii]
MKLTVDRDRCEGYGFCEQAAPSLLRLDDDGEVELLTDLLRPSDISSAEAATRACPVAALRVVEQ